MSQIPAVLYLNKSAGNGESVRCRSLIVDHMTQMGWGVSVIESTDRDEGLQELKERLPETEVLIVAGGDGTINQVLSVVMDLGADVLFGIIPAGTGNDFARAIDLDLSTVNATRKLFDDHRIQAVDIGRALWFGSDGDGSAYFLNVCGIGFDAQIALTSDKYKILGQASYLAAAFDALLSSPSQIGRVMVDGAMVFEGDFHLTSVANGKYSGGGFALLPDASPVDAVFGVGIVTPASKLEMVKLLNLVKSGGNGDSESLLRMRGTQVEVFSETPVPIHLDGEVLSEHVERLQVEVMPQALRVLVPSSATL